MTSRISNLLQQIQTNIQELSTQYPAINCDPEINEHLNALFDGMGLRILNSLDSESLGAFLFFQNKFYLLVDQNGLGQLKPIKDEQAIEILCLFYVCRALTRLSNVDKKVIIEYNKKLNYKIDLYFEFD